MTINKAISSRRPDRHFRLIKVCLLSIMITGSAMARTQTGSSSTYYELDGGVLTISGTGAMPDFLSAGLRPWHHHVADIRQVVIEAGVTQIGANSFAGCGNLTDVTVSDDVTRINGYAFRDCGSLTGITIPKGVTTVESNVFAGCGSLNDITVHPDNIAFKDIDGVLCSYDGTVLHAYPGGRAGSYTTPGSVTDIRLYAFYECTGLTDVTISDGVTTIGIYAFSKSSLTNVVIPASVTTFDHAFENCHSLTGVTITGSGAMTTISGYAFGTCRDLTSVDIKATGITTIGECAFESCGSLTDIYLPASLTTIGHSAFRHSGLTSVTIPASLTTIINGPTFYRCDDLTTVTMQGGEPPSLTTDIFSYASALATIHVPNSAVETYKGAAQWNIHSDKIQGYTPSTIWKTDAASADWTDSDNWTDGLPGQMTKVTIPTGATLYPVLTDTCKIHTILFRPGAELGRQDLLVYEKAFVEYDLETAPRSDHFRMLSVPLMEAWPGDFTFGGLPKVYLQTFETDETDGKGRWVTAAGGNTGVFTAGTGFVLSVGTDDSPDKGLGLSGGILRLPFYDSDSDVDPDVHPNHHYRAAATGESGATGQSTFTDPNGGEDDYYRVSRAAEGHRLAGAIVETAPYFGQGGDSRFALVGNPFMQTIDFDRLQSENDELIKNSYHVWTKVGDRAGYVSYHPESAFGLVGTSPDRRLAPLQGFIVERADEGAGALTFDLAKVASEDKTSLRGDRAAAGKLSIIAGADRASVLTFIASRAGGSPRFGGGDARKLMNSLSDVPEIYTLKPSDNGPVAVGANITNNEDAVYPLGLATTFEGEITFAFSGMDSYDTGIFFVDRLTGDVIDLTGMMSYEYKFDYTPPRNDSVIISDDDRFVIHIGAEPTGDDETEPTDDVSNEPTDMQSLSVYANNGFIYASSAKLIIREISVYNLQGTEVYHSKVNDMSLETTKSFTPGVYIVRIKTDYGVVSRKVVSLG